MKFSGVLLYNLKIIFRCGGILYLTSGEFERSITSNIGKYSFYHGIRYNEHARHGDKFIFISIKVLVYHTKSLMLLAGVRPNLR